jgi:hypothetical protein
VKHSQTLGIEENDIIIESQELRVTLKRENNPCLIPWENKDYFQIIELTLTKDKQLIVIFNNQDVVKIDLNQAFSHLSFEPTKLNLKVIETPDPKDCVRYIYYNDKDSSWFHCLDGLLIRRWSDPVFSSFVQQYAEDTNKKHAEMLVQLREDRGISRQQAADNGYLNLEEIIAFEKAVSLERVTFKRSLLFDFGMSIGLSDLELQEILLPASDQELGYSINSYEYYSTNTKGYWNFVSEGLD